MNLLSRILRFAWFYWHLSACRVTGRVPIVIYQMGKVGSASIFNSLRKAGVRGVFHVHRMNRAHIDEVNRSRGRAFDVSDRIGLALKKHFVDRRKPMRLIVPIREPVGRNLSAFFENLGVHSSNPKSADVQQHIDEFFANYPHDTPLNWFDWELRAVFGLDIYDIPFDRNNGYVIASGTGFELLLFRSELGDDVKAAIIREFLGLPEFELIRTNVGQQKEYARQYEEFKSRIAIPDAYVRSMYESRYVQHFYPEKFLE